MKATHVRPSPWGGKEPDILDADLREHAIFALRNLLQDNVENQQVVQEFKPLRDFDKDGILKNLAGHA